MIGLSIKKNNSIRLIPFIHLSLLAFFFFFSSFFLFSAQASINKTISDQTNLKIKKTSPRSGQRFLIAFQKNISLENFNRESAHLIKNLPFFCQQNLQLIKTLPKLRTLIIKSSESLIKVEENTLQSKEHREYNHVREFGENKNRKETSKKILVCLNLIERNPLLAFVEKDHWISFDNHFSMPLNQFQNFQKSKTLLNTEMTNPSPSPSLPWGLIALRVPEVWEKGYRGQGVKVLILDTGIDRDHPALKNQIRSIKAFAREENPSIEAYPGFDTSGHGSHVAGIIAGAFNLNESFIGEAPESQLWIGKVCNLEGCATTDVIEGIEWGLSESVNVMNLSLGIYEESQALKTAIIAAEQAGIVVVAASGNRGIQQMAYPARYPSVISVGAINQEFQKTFFSEWGSELCVMAPGTSILSSVPRGSGRKATLQIQIDNGPFLDIKVVAAVGSGLWSKSLKKALVYAKTGSYFDFLNPEVRNLFVLVKGGQGVSTTEQVSHAQNKGAAGLIIVNGEPGEPQTTWVYNRDTRDFPVVVIEKEMGEKLIEIFNPPPPPPPTGFPKRIITSQLDVQSSDYMLYLGTSMAAPYVTGLVALLLSSQSPASIPSSQKTITILPSQVRQAIKASSRTLSCSALECGSGLADAAAALTYLRGANYLQSTSE